MFFTLDEFERFDREWASGYCASYTNWKKDLGLDITYEAGRLLNSSGKFYVEFYDNYKDDKPIRRDYFKALCSILDAIMKKNRYD